MNSARTSLIAPFLAFVVACAALLAMPPAVAAEDVLILENGEELKGDVVREVEGGHVLFRYEIAGVVQEKWFSAGRIKSLVRDDEPAPSEAPDAPEPAPDDGARDTPALAPADPEDRFSSSTPRIAIISMEEMVGMYMTAKPLRDAIPLLEKEGVTDVVFRINSGGGALIEIQKLSDVIQEEYKPRFRVAAWIESAISAAAMTAHVIEEIYFMPQGNYGACTGFQGATLEAISGYQLEQVLNMMEKISRKGRKDPIVMRAMQIHQPLSASIDEHGQVHWYADLNGDYVLNNGSEILTFTAPEADRFGFSKGTAATKEELARLMGYEEVEWVGKQVPGRSYPVSLAEQHQIDYRKQVREDSRRTNEYFTTYSNAIQMAQGRQNREDRAPLVGKARQALKQIDHMIRNNPNFALFILGMPVERYDEWLREQQRILRELMRE